MTWPSVPFEFYSFWSHDTPGQSAGIGLDKSEMQMNISEYVWLHVRAYELVSA